MKTQNKLFLGALTLTATAASAQAMPFNEGGYVGRLNREKNVHLMVRKIEGRQGSFMAVLFKKRDEACTYIVDPTENPSEYVMIPLQATNDGEIGFNNANPSLTMHLSNSSMTDPEFIVTNANGGNSHCIQGSAIFKGRDSRFHWDDAIISGAYHAGGFRSVGQISTSFVQPGDSSMEGSMILTRPFKRPGKYNIREKAPGLFTMKISGRTETGPIEETHPTYIGFSASTCWGASVYLVNPADYTDVIHLNAKDDY